MPSGSLAQGPFGANWVLELGYPDAAGAIIDQHGFNLLWIGVVTLVCSWFIWHRSLVSPPPTSAG